MIETKIQNLPLLLRKSKDLNCVNDPKNAKEEKQLGVQSLVKITITISVISISKGLHCFHQKA